MLLIVNLIVKMDTPILPHFGSETLILCFFTVLRKSFYRQYGLACFLTGIKQVMFITMIIRALTHGVYYMGQVNTRALLRCQFVNHQI